MAAAAKPASQTTWRRKVAETQRSPQRYRQTGDRWLPVLLVVFALGDLHTELQLLWDHFTFTALLFAIRGHALAVIVLIISPSLWRRYGASRGIRSSEP